MRLRCSTLLQEKRVSALTVNSLHAEPKAAKTKIERFRRKWKAPSESARSFLKLPFGERGEMSKCAYVVFFHLDFLLVILHPVFENYIKRGKMPGIIPGIFEFLLGAFPSAFMRFLGEKKLIRTDIRK